MPNRLNSHIKLFTDLSKIKIPVAVSLSALTGYLIFSRELNMGALVMTAGVFLLAAGSAALNQYQEHRYDAIMGRTKGRPIPSGRLGVVQTLVLSIGLALSGVVVLFLGSSPLSCMIGLLTLFWYNGIYTPMKRKTVFAILAGALVGAFPPMIGWTAAGGYLFDPTIILISTLLFVWQVPHFILLLLKYGEEYEVAGFSTLTTVFSEAQLKKLIFIWILATAFAVIIIPVAGIINSIVITIALLISSLWLVASFYMLLRKKSFPFATATIRINLFLILVLVLFSVDSLV